MFFSLFIGNRCIVQYVVWCNATCNITCATHIYCMCKTSCSVLRNTSCIIRCEINATVCIKELQAMIGALWARKLCIGNNVPKMVSLSNILLSIKCYTRNIACNVSASIVWTHRATYCAIYWTMNYYIIAIAELQGSKVCWPILHAIFQLNFLYKNWAFYSNALIAQHFICVDF